jgi:hypothetical protein
MKFPRSSGVLLHPTSLPGRHAFGWTETLAGSSSQPKGLRRIALAVFFRECRKSAAHNAVVAGGGFMLIAALLMQRGFDPEEQKQRTEEKQDSKQLATGPAR